MLMEIHHKPEVLRGQSKVNHQGSEGEIDINADRENALNKHFDNSYEIYKYLYSRKVKSLFNSLTSTSTPF